MKRATVTIAMSDKCDFEVGGYEFEVDGIPLVVHRIGPDLGWSEYSPKGWSVTEPLTGCGLGPMSKTRTGACMQADNLVRRKGAAVVKRLIRNQLKAAK
jgi:hypothetical protein